jgi:hypothetical protein
MMRSSGYDAQPVMALKRLRYKGRIRGMMRKVIGINSPHKRLKSIPRQAIVKAMWKPFDLIKSSVSQREACPCRPRSTLTG